MYQCELKYIRPLARLVLGFDICKKKREKSNEQSQNENFEMFGFGVVNMAITGP